MEQYIGRKLEGRYEISELIGFGGMAVVFKAYDLLEKKHVAVKILKDEYLESEDFKRRFRNESKAIALLSHPNVVKVLDVNFSDNIQYIVMEYIDGITLKEYIEQQARVKWKEAVYFTLQILRALQHAHDNGIVHRDVKPQNVMLLQDGTIKVMDFGIARFARETGKTISEKAIGSVHYISPEQARGEQTDEKTDIYSVGVIMYEMLTGKVPFDGDSAVSIAIKQMQEELTLPSKINPDIPHGLEEIIVRAMQKDSALRYQTAAEMLRDINEFKQNPGVVFEYKYMDLDGTTRYFDKIDTGSPVDKKRQVAHMEAPKKRSYTMNILAGVTAACVLLAVVAFYMFMKGVNSKTDELTLKNVVGMTVAQAQQTNPDVKFKVIQEIASPDYDKGMIIEQKPIADTKIKKNSEVELVVSSGISSFVMPELRNETASAAKQTLNELGITDITIANKPDATIALGRVISTDPAAQTELKKGDKVILYVSAGAADEPVRMPDLTGKSEIEARAALSKLDISIGKVSYEGSLLPKGQISWQSIEKDTKVKKGSSVEIKISNGEPPSTTDGNSIHITFPAGADNKNFEFEVVLNGVLLETRAVNPSITRDFKIAFTLNEEQLINGVVPMQDINDVTITTGGSLFAQYTIDFQNGMISPTFEPNFDVVFENGYVPGGTSSTTPATNDGEAIVIN